jgi:competence protein ComEC
VSDRRRGAPRLGGLPGWTAIAAVAAAQLSLLPIPASILHAGAPLLALGSLMLLLLPPPQRANLRATNLFRAALLGALLISARIALLGLPVPPADSAATLVPAGEVRGQVEALLVPLRGAQRFIVEINGVHIQVEAPPNPSLRTGDTIITTLVQRSVTPDAQERLRIRGISASARTRSVQLISRGSPLESLRAALGDAIERVLPAPAGGLAAAIVIGLRERVDERLATDFTATGLGHVVALSGWNVAITMAVADRFTKRLPAKHRRPLLIVVAIAYGLFAGASASVIRASFMAAAALIGAASGRPGSGAVALSHAVLALMVLDPAIAADPGFRLSALATAGLLAKSQRWSDRAAAFGDRIPKHFRAGWSLIGGDIAVSLAAQAATLGLVIALFGRVAVWSIPLTLLIAPLIAPATAAAILATIAGELVRMVPPQLAVVPSLLALPAAALFSAAAWIAQVGAHLPAGGIEVPRGATLAVGLALGAVGIWLLLRDEPQSTPAHAAEDAVSSSPVTERLAIGIAVLIAVSALTSLGNAVPRGSLRITTLDVGQGDAILIEVSGRRMLIDGGPDPARLSTELDRIIPAWDRRIDLLVASHPHEDHLAGLPKLLDRYRISSVIGSEDRGGGPAASSWREILAASRIAYHQVFTGDRFQLGAARLSVLWPDESYLSLPPGNDGRALNDRSIVLRLDIPGFSALFTGDIESDIDPRILRNITAPVDVLKAPHHGSKGAASRALLEALNPRVSVVSVGVNNSYGHPATETIARLGERGGVVERTDLNGTVTITVPLQQPHYIRIESQKGIRAAPARSAIGRRAPSAVPADAIWPTRLASVSTGGGGSGCPIPRARIRPWERHRYS